MYNKIPLLAIYFKNLYNKKWKLRKKKAIILNLLYFYLQQFKKNLNKCNGGEDFDQDMLEEIYNAIRYTIIYK